VLRSLHNRRAQNFFEYAILVAVIATALIAMSQYMQRSINARLKQVQEELNESKR
jgi:Flp pilus assembly pilin Flp